MNLGGVLQDDELCIVIECDPKLLAALPAVLKESLPEAGVHPGFRHHLGSKDGRSGIEHLDLSPNFLGTEHLPLEQQFT
ncbi:hypothetical protein OHAE_5506 [Ochrobactrum soli]|uniref:Uncharacterized protein n=1 Tax=Ochrobactrum soli TaxID=2448455 RepID=A0A2P9HEB7_9HYPH|nr:hypothetical protein OHAE_5506 [[Ochrobactrum] soli]